MSSLDSDGRVSLGGVVVTARRTKRPRVGSFEGCLRDVTVNGVALNPTASNAIVSVGVSVCDECRT